MNIPCMLGVVCFFGPQSIKYGSKAGLAITLNGIMYYLNHKSKILRINDIFWNALLGVSVCVLNESSRKYIAIGTLLWIINNYKLNGRDLVHVFGVQLPIAIALYKYLKN